MLKMPSENKIRLQAPGGSWETIKRIIRAYHAAEDVENPTVEDVAGLAGVQRPVVSSNNNFLRSTGLLQDGANKLSPVGTRLSTGLAMGNGSLVSSALQDVVRAQEGLSHLVNLLRARSSMSIEAVKGEIIMLCGLGPDSRNLPFVKAVIDLLQEALIVKVEDDQVIFRGFYVGNISGIADPPPPPAKSKGQEKTPSATAQVIPIPLGVGRLVHVELPDDWTPKDLPKLLKLLELSLGEGEP